MKEFGSEPFQSTEHRFRQSCADFNRFAPVFSISAMEAAPGSLER
jgi:hypothetical protein